MDFGIIVLAELLLLLRGPAAQGNANIALGILAANHEADLARRIGRYGGVGVFGNREDLLAILLELGDQGQVQPLVFGCWVFSC